MRFQTAVGRVAALATLIGALALVAIVLFGGGERRYRATARFVNAGQLVKGNPVQAGGVPIGSVTDIRVADDGQVDIGLAVDREHAPLPRGTRATVRQFSLSGIANRYVDLTFPPHDSRGTIPDGGRIGVDDTSTQVDLDQVLNALDPRTRRALQRGLEGSARAFHGRGEQLGRGIEYLNPGLSTTGRLLRELTRDRPVLDRTLLDSSRLVAALAERRDDLATLVGDLNRVTRAIGSQKGELAESIQRLPPFLRRANTTFLNLSAALDDVDPVVDALKPAARNLPALLVEARRFAAGARPTIRDLRRAIRRRGRGNDATDLVRAVPRLADIAVETKRRALSPGGRRVGVGETRGALPEAAAAFGAATPVIGFARPYTTDFLGWLDDFSTTGGYFDATGGITRTFVSVAENLSGAPPKTGQFRRCPGGADIVAPDRSNVLGPEEQARLACTEEHRAVR